MTGIIRRAGKDIMEKGGIRRISWRQCDKQGEKHCGRSRRGSVSNKGVKQQGSHQEKQ